MTDGPAAPATMEAGQPAASIAVTPESTSAQTDETGNAALVTVSPTLTTVLAYKNVPGYVTGGGSSTQTLPSLGSVTTYWSNAKGTTDGSGDATVPVYDGSTGLSAVWSSPSVGTRTGRLSTTLVSSTSGLTMVVQTEAVAVTGTVTYAAGGPVPGAKVVLNRQSSDYTQNATDATTTTADGAWTLHGPSGNDYVTVSGDGLAGLPHLFSLGRLVTAPGSADLALPVRTVTVTVTDQAGVPVPGANVTSGDSQLEVQWSGSQVYGRQTATPPGGLTTAADGTVALKVVPGYLTNLQAAFGGKAGQVYSTVIGASDLSITVKLCC